MKKGKTVLFLFLIILSVFLFLFVNQKSDASQSLNREVTIIDEREKIAETAFAEDEEIVVFGNEENELYQDLISFLEEGNYSYTKYLISDSSFLDKLSSYKKEYGSSEGMSKSFRYYPFIFLKEKAFSGFNSVIKEEIEKELKI